MQTALEELSTEKKERYKVWLRQSKYDLGAARISLSEKYYEWACFQSEQSTEKALKSVLVQAGWRPPKMHKLSVLVSFCNHANEKFNKTKLNFRDLESFTFISRYPFLIPGNGKTPHESITHDDAINCINQANSMYSKIYKILEGNPVTYSEETIERGVNSAKLEKRINDSVEKLVKAFNPVKIYLFGSYARGDYKDGSTIDILIIANTQIRFLDRIREAIKITAHGFPPIEPLVYTEDEFKHLVNSEGFFQTAMEESRLLYDNGKITKNVLTRKG